MNRKYLVAFVSDGPSFGTTIVTTEDMPVTSEWIREVEKHLAERVETARPGVFNVIPLELVADGTNSESGNESGNSGKAGEKSKP